MKKEDLITKWLDNNLNSQELEAFKELDDYTELIRLDNAIKRFKPNHFDTDSELEKLNLSLKNRTQKQNNWLKPLLRVAAVITICFGFYYFTSNIDTSIKTEIAQKESISLPDESQVILNAMSTLTYNDNNWDSNRNLDLNGEAYFKVAKGEKFTVNTTSGSISVLGTEFNVKNRDDLFEVICYEGSVKVESELHSKILKPGERFLILDNIFIKDLTVIETNPYWINNESAFKSMPFSQVIAEFERQYNVSIDVNNINTKKLFTGSFGHDNIDVAIKAITIPLNLTFTRNSNKISLKRE
ncbi:FecR family protein [uncultured Lacinutrix sp.]|uniref:FecR family protein n=1 Tax=uncultured Lacinutrix sp. TaxID=574032 RepID=UPI0026137682|nr:FecR family protein [uncultured Lacinutrix sp.]